MLELSERAENIGYHFKIIRLARDQSLGGDLQSVLDKHCKSLILIMRKKRKTNSKQARIYLF